MYVLCTHGSLIFCLIVCAPCGLSPFRVEEIRAVWNTRWDWFHKPIHAVAHVLHPLWRTEDQYSNDELEEGFMNYMRRVTGDDLDMMRRIEDDLLTFRNHSLHFGRPTARLRETQLQPVSWWEKYGNCAPTLVCDINFIVTI